MVKKSNTDVSFVSLMESLFRCPGSGCFSTNVVADGIVSGRTESEYIIAGDVLVGGVKETRVIVKLCGGKGG